MTAAGPETRHRGDTGFPAFAERFRDDAAEWDHRQLVPEPVLESLAGVGWLGAAIPAGYGGSGMDVLQLGRMCHALGSVCTSLRSLITVQCMVAQAILRWGRDEQRNRWLPKLASGATIAGLAATEQDAGSDLSAVRTEIRPDGDGYLITGEKRWVTFGERAGLYLVLGQLDGKSCAVLVDRDAPGVQVEPIRSQLGLRAAMLADVHLTEVRVPAENLLARPGVGLSHVINGALDHGRYTVAWGCAGMVRTCLELSAAHAAARQRGGRPLAAHQLVDRLVADMVVDAQGSEMLCERAAGLLDEGGADTSTTIMVAKYHAARAAARVSADAVQVHGAAGCAAGSVAERFYRDAKIMQIIEGSDQISQLAISGAAFRRYAPKAVR